MRVKKINKEGIVHDLIEVIYPEKAYLMIEIYADGDILYNVTFNPPATFILYNKMLNSKEKIHLVGGYIPDNLGERLKQSGEHIRTEKLIPRDDLDPEQIEYYLIDSEEAIKYFIRKRVREISQGYY